GGNIVLINEESVIDDDDTEWTFWKGTLDIVYLGVELDFNDISTSTVKLNSDLWVNNAKIQLGYKEGGNILPGLEIGFNGDVNFSNYRLVGELSFDLEVLQFGLSQVTPVQGSDFGFSISGNLGMTISSVTSDITFADLEINPRGEMPNIASSISGGQFTIGDVFSLEMLTFEYKAPMNDGSKYDLSYNLGGIPPEGENGSNEEQNVQVDAYLQFGINVTVGDVFSGGVDRFLLFYNDGTPNLIMNNLNLSINDVFEASIDLAYLTYNDGFSFLVAGEADVKNTMHFAVVGAFEKRGGTLRFGMFAMAELPGAGIVLYPGIFLAEVGGGFFYNPREEWLSMVVAKTPLGSHPITAELPTGEHYGGGDLSFAIMLYAGI
ncbi:MAG: hypothetical protein KAR38_09760, partial [Calditrichia bacterium]|nr:hypothetical protein [Calditrichia bacterium]